MRKCRDMGWRKGRLHICVGRIGTGSNASRIRKVWLEDRLEGLWRWRERYRCRKSRGRSGCGSHCIRRSWYRSSSGQLLNEGSLYGA
jgi:hypothetical protein